MKVANKIILGLLAVFLLNLTAHSQAIKNKKVSVIAQNEPLESVLDKLSQDSDASFIYNSDLIKNELVTIQFSNQKMEKVLFSLLDEKFEYIIRGDYIIIQKKQKQKKVTIQIQGKFTDAQTGEQLDNATIYEAKNLTSSISNDQGLYNFSFDTDQDEPSLIISKENYKDTVVLISHLKSKKLDIQLQPAPPRVEPQVSLHNQIMVRILTTKELRKNAKNVDFLDEVPFQLSLVPAVGTNRLFGSSMSNHLSLNLIAGYSYGVEGLEMGGVYNIVKNDVHGVQLGGAGNSVGGDVEGMQLGGASNVNIGNTRGLQMAGAVNYVGEKSEGLQVAGAINISKLNAAQQISGFLNLVFKESNGLQLAGALNIAGNSQKSIQIAGFGNTVLHHNKGFQLGGAYNSSGDMKGTQLAGALNISRNINGAQVAGATNFSRDLDGLQLSSALNIARNVKGVQISSGINFAKEVRGTQIALINIADTLSNGVPIGLINIIRKGFIHVDLSANDVTPLRISFKSGTNRLYTILSTGVSPAQDVWTYGVGLGTYFKIRKHFFSSIEANTNWINPLAGFIENSDIWNQYLINFGYKLSDNLSIHVGPTMNNYWSKFVDDETGEIGLLDNNGFSEKVRENKLSRHWIGWQVGLMF